MRFRISLVFFVLFLVENALARPIKIIVPAFAVHTAENLDYLKTALKSMLLTRLLQEGEFETVEPPAEAPMKPKGQTTQEQTKSKPEKFEPVSLKESADFLLRGALNKIGNAVSLDVEVVDLKTGAGVGGAFVEGENLDSLVKMVETLAKNLGRTLAPPTGESASRKTESSSKTAVEPPPPQTIESKEAEKPVVEEEREKPKETQVAKRPSPALAAPFAEKKWFGPLWQSEKLPSEIRGIALGNVTKKGPKELVVLTRQSLLIYEIKDNGLRFQRDFKANPQEIFLRVDVSDVSKGEGYLLFLTSWRKNQIRSMVLRVTSRGTQQLGQDLNWFFRVVDLPALGTRLVGQRFDPNLTFGGAVTLLVNKNGKLTEGDQLRLPSSANIYNFNFVETKGSFGVIVEGEDGLLRFYSADGRLEWASKESYPGSTYYIIKGKAPIFGRTFVRQSDGRNPELFLYHNRGTFLRTSTDAKAISSGVLGFGWDGEKIVPLWETTGIEGEITDFQVGDMDDQAGDEMIVASVLKPEKGSKKPLSVLTVYKRP